MKKNLAKQGLILVNVLVFAVIAVIIMTALVTWGSYILKSYRQLAAKQQAFEIAEAGVELLPLAPGGGPDGL